MKGKSKDIWKRLHERCEPYLDDLFPKTNNDDPSKPSEGNRANALTLYGLMLTEFVKEISTLKDQPLEKEKELREEWNKFVETLPTRVGETPKEVIADWWLSKLEDRPQTPAERWEEINGVKPIVLNEGADLIPVPELDDQPLEKRNSCCVKCKGGGTSTWDWCVEKNCLCHQPLEKESWEDDDSPYRTALADAMMMPVQALKDGIDGDIFADKLIKARNKVNKEVSSLTKQVLEDYKAELLWKIERAIGLTLDKAGEIEMNVETGRSANEYLNKEDIKAIISSPNNS